MKVCSKCHIEKSEDQFSKKRDKLQPYCKACHSIYLKEHYQNNKSYYIDRAKSQKKDMSNWMKEYKSTLSCTMCPESEPVCLDFHHLDGDTKDFTVSSMIVSGHSKDSILLEIAKCIVLCSNCHRKVHAGILVPPVGIGPTT